MPCFLITTTPTYNSVLRAGVRMLDYTSKRLLDKLLNKVWPDDPGIKSPVSQASFLPCAVNATMHHCTLAPLQQHPQPPPVSHPSVNRQPKTIETLLHICMAWNKGVCKHVNCTFRHICATCQQLHKVWDCPTTPANSKYKLVALLSSKPSTPQRMTSFTRL